MPVSFWALMNLLSQLAEFVRRLFGPRKKKGEGDTEAGRKLQKVLGYRFSSPALLRQSLTHKSSVVAEDTKGLLSNERLEFLGDAVLNCLSTEYLYLTHPDKSEGQLSKIKSLVVSRAILGDVAQRIDLGKYMIFGTSEEKSGGRDRVSLMSNAFEAVLGAVYLDGGLEETRKILDRFLFGRIPEFLRDERNVNYKSRVLELSQRDGLGVPRYVTVETAGPDHARMFTVQIEIAGVVLGTGRGTNKKIAQQHAAQQAVEQYNKDMIVSRSKGESNDELVSDR